MAFTTFHSQCSFGFLSGESSLTYLLEVIEENVGSFPLWYHDGDKVLWRFITLGILQSALQVTAETTISNTLPDGIKTTHFFLLTSSHSRHNILLRFSKFSDLKLISEILLVTGLGRTSNGYCRWIPSTEKQIFPFH